MSVKIFTIFKRTCYFKTYLTSEIKILLVPKTGKSALQYNQLQKNKQLNMDVDDIETAKNKMVNEM